MPGFAANSGLTEVTTTSQAKLGDLFLEYHPTYGERIWVYVKNSDAVSVTAGMLCIRKDSTLEHEVIALPATATDAQQAVSRAIGFAQHTIAAGSYGWILAAGVGTVLADTGGITANQFIQAGDAALGGVDSAVTEGRASLGWAHVAIAAAATGLARVRCPGAGAGV
jgi:hypothetical protein